MPTIPDPAAHAWLEGHGDDERDSTSAAGSPAIDLEALAIILLHAGAIDLPRLPSLDVAAPTLGLET